MNKMYHLGNCTTCQAIIKDTGADQAGLTMQDIKFEKITPAQLDEMKKMAGSYEALFSRRALKYKALGLKDKKESDLHLLRQSRFVPALFELLAKVPSLHKAEVGQLLKGL